MTTRSFLATLTITFTSCTFKTADISFGEKEETCLTVLKLDNQNPGFEYNADTLMNGHVMDLTKNKIDVFFSHRNFQIPYYMPTNGIYRDSIKDKECNWKTYPATVKCYEYDSTNRVIKMQVESSGTTGSYTFVYDNNEKIIEMQGNGGKYKMTYDGEGNLTKMTVDGGTLQTKLTFIYTRK